MSDFSTLIVNGNPRSQLQCCFPFQTANSTGHVGCLFVRTVVFISAWCIGKAAVKESLLYKPPFGLSCTSDFQATHYSKPNSIDTNCC